MAVVDGQLSVHGRAGPRVIDASVMPAVTSTTNAPTIMIAEKGAAMIKGAARCFPKPGKFPMRRIRGAIGLRALP